MNTHIRKFSIVFLVMVIGVIGCTPQAATLSPLNTSAPPTPTATPPLPPVCQSLETQDTPSELKPKDVVTEMVLALNTGDVAKAMSFFAEDTKGYVIGVPPNSLQSMIGKEEICRFLAGYANNNVEWELTNLSSINAFNSLGSADVSAKSNIGLDDYRQLGIASLQFLDKYLVYDGKITEYEAWLTKGSLDQLREVLPEIAFTNPDISSGTPGSEVTIVFSNHICTYEGPSVWQSGDIDFTIEVLDHKDVKNGFFILNLDEGYDVFELAVSLLGHRPFWAKYKTLFEADYYDTSTIQHHISADADEIYVVCAGGDRGWVIGILGPFEVIP